MSAYKKLLQIMAMCSLGVKPSILTLRVGLCWLALLVWGVYVVFARLHPLRVAVAQPRGGFAVICAQVR